MKKTLDINFWHLLPQGVGERDRIQNLGKFADSSSIKCTKRARKGCTL